MIEHVVIDGASRDATLEVIRAHPRQPEVLISEPDRGIYDALNKGIARATGDVVGFLHADDVYASARSLERVAEAFDDPQVGAVYGDLEYVRQDDIGRVIRRWKSRPFESKILARGWMPPHPTLYVRREWYSRIGGFDTHYSIAADYASILKLFSCSDLKPVYIPELLVKMRMGGASNKSVRNIIRKSREDWGALRDAGMGRRRSACALALKNLSKLRQFV